MYNSNQKEVLDLVPGITNIASIEYRDENELLNYSENPEEQYINEVMPEKIKINLTYAKKANICSDVKVILKTLLKIFW